MSNILILRISNKDYRLTVVKKKLKDFELVKDIQGQGKSLRDLIPELTDILRRVSEEYKVKDVIIIIPFNEVITHSIKLPLKSPQDLARALPFELEDLLPLPPEDYLLSFDIVNKVDNESEIVTAALALKKAEEYLGIIENRGLRTVGLKTYFVEAINCTIRSGRIINKDFCILMREGDYFCIACFRDNCLRLLKHTKNKEILIKDLEKLKQEGIQKIYTLLEDIPLIKDAEVLQLNERDVLLSTLKKGKINFDFVKKPEGIKTELIKKVTVAVFSIALILHLCSAAVPYWLDYRELKKINSAIEEIRKDASDVIENSRRLAELTESLRNISEIKNSAVKPLSCLREITARLPEDSWLTHFKYDKGVIELRGFSRHAVSAIKSLENSKLFRNLKLTSALTTRGEEEQFNIRIEVTR
jgi:predicted transcriptional regulator